MTNNFFPPDVQEASKKMGGEWISADEFETGLVLQVSKPMEKVRATIPKYGANDSDYLVKKDILEVGETFRYHFKTPEGIERKIDSKSTPFFIGLRQVEELGVGDWLKITRTGETFESRYTVEKVEAPKLTVSHAKESTKDTGVSYPKDEINPDDIPF